jgi:putative holliday junction resolvase
MRVMGLDVGDRRIGVAVSDPEGWLAQGVTVITHTTLQRDLGALRSMIVEQGVGEVVVGLPRRMDGTLGPQAEKCQAFGQALQEATGVPVVFWDERLTTVEAERSMIAAGMKRAKRKTMIDMTAATILLQSYLDYVTRRRAQEQSES